MAKNESKSLAENLAAGQTDGKYRKVRPDTTVADAGGDKLIRSNRGDLNPFYNYGFLTQEQGSKQRPGSL